MLQDILLNMLSTKDDSNMEIWMNTSMMKMFLHPAEETAICQVLEIASKYREINKFITKTVDGNEDGLYMKAFCKGLHMVLNQYRMNVIQLEKELLNNSQLSLMYICTKLNDYESLFKSLVAMITKITETQVKGCLLIGALDVFLYCANPNLNGISRSILKPVNEVFYQHMAVWIVYGTIQDPYEEFFICDSKCPDNFFQYANVVDTKKPPTIRRFFIKEDLLPSVINTSTANLILLVGRMVWIMKNKSNDCFTPCDNVWNGKELDYYIMIKNLGTKSFSLRKIRAALNECKSKLSESLLAMFDSANLMEHFQMIRDYYTLGRGGLFQHFIEICLQNPTCKNLVVLNAEFREIATTLYTDKDKSHKRFELMFGNDLKNTNALTLNFDAEWPLHIIFHPKALEAYNKLFSYLLRLKMANVNLCKLWFLHNKQRIANRKVVMLRHNLKIFVDRMEYYLQVDVIEASFYLLKENVKQATDFEMILHLHVDFLTSLLSKCFIMDVTNEENSDILHHIPKVNDTINVYETVIKLLNLSDDFCKDVLNWPVQLDDEHFDKLIQYSYKGNNILRLLRELVRDIFSTKQQTHLIKLGFHLKMIKF